MHLRQLSTVETIEIHYQNAHFFHLLQPCSTLCFIDIFKVDVRFLI